MAANSTKPLAPPPTYQPPGTGIFRVLPASFVPYAELMRLDRPAGFYAFYWHYSIGLAFAACIAPTLLPLPSSSLLLFAAFWALWVVVFRGAVCTWNDNLDQDLDRQVARCRFRPIARGAVRTLPAHGFTVAQLLLCAAMLAPFPTQVWGYATLMTVILAIYPLGKRMTDFPQVILGVGFGIPVFMCCAALGVDPLSQPEAFGMNHARGNVWVGAAAACLYAANFLWTIVFDTVYAHQDIKDDIKAGVKSLAVRLGAQTKLYLGILSGIQVGLLVATGYFCDFAWTYFVLGCGGAASALFGMLLLVDLESPASCAWWFGPGSRLVGASVVLGLLSHYVLRHDLSLN